MQAECNGRAQCVNGQMASRWTDVIEDFFLLPPTHTLTPNLNLNLTPGLNRQLGARSDDTAGPEAGAPVELHAPANACARCNCLTIAATLCIFAACAINCSACSC